MFDNLNIDFENICYILSIFDKNVRYERRFKF